MEDHAEYADSVQRPAERDVPTSALERRTKTAECSVGDFEPSRRPWRTLVRVEEVDQERGYAYVIVPPWDVTQKIRVDLEAMPAHIRPLIEAGRRLHTFVNTGAESHEDLRFDNWEAQ